MVINPHEPWSMVITTAMRVAPLKPSPPWPGEGAAQRSPSDVGLLRWENSEGAFTVTRAFTR